MKDLYPAQLDGYTLEIEDINDRFENAIARHEIPMQAGALLENMGQRARSVNFRCYFWDHGSHQSYADHIDFINHLKKTTLSELVHPQYGRMQGMIESFDVRHDDRELTAEVDVVFIEELRGAIADLEYQDVATTVEEALAVAQVEQVASLAEIIRDASRKTLKRIEGHIATFEGTLLDVANPANGVISAIDYGTSLPGRVIGALARCIERYVKLNESIVNAPSRFLDNMEQAMLKLEATVEGFDDQVRVGFAVQAAHALAGIYKEDEDQRGTVRRAEKQESFDVQGRYRGESEQAAILDATELERSLAKARTMLQDAIDRDRSITSLKVMAGALLEHVNQVKLERDRIITVEIDPAMPLQLICLKYGLPHSMAPRILSINPGIRNPAMVSGTVQLYGR